MAVHLRLQRHGTRNRPFYHIVAADSRKARDGQFIEKLGTYDPFHEPSIVDVKADRIAFWFERGAQMTNTVSKLIKHKKLTLTRAKTEARAAAPKKAVAKK